MSAESTYQVGASCSCSNDSYTVLRALCTRCGATWEYLAPGRLACAIHGDQGTGDTLEKGVCPRCRLSEDA